MKKQISAILTAVMLVSLLTACGKSTESTTTAPATEPTAAAAETTTTEATSKADEKTTEPADNGTSDSAINVSYSANFKIEELGNGVKRVTDGDSRELILYPKALGEVPAEYENSTVITTPVENAVFMSATQTCMLRADDSAEIWDAVGAVNSDAASFVGLDGLVSRMDSGDIINVGGEFGEPDYEKISELAPDIVFVYTGDYGQQSVIAKLDELGINYAVDNEFMETDYLARMEWMKFILTFYNADEAADKYMTSAVQTIDGIKSKLAGVEGKKVAMFNVYDGLGYGTSDFTWSGCLLRDMGGINVFADVTEYTITAEALYEYVQDADVIIYTITPMYCGGLSAMAEAFPQLTECKAYTDGNVYQYSDAYWVSIDQTDVVASDLASIINPDLFGSRELTYFLKAE